MERLKTKWIFISIIFLLLILLIRIVSNPFDKKPTDLENISLGNEARNNLSDRVGELLPEPQAALLSGMLLGVKSDLPRDFNQALKNTSTIHIVVVSGQNLSLVAGFFLSLAPLLGRRKTTLLSLVAVLGYLVLTGFQVPSIRAAIMVLLGSLAVLAGREKDSGWVLLLTVLLMLIYNPSWLYSISFQLSVSATFGVIVVAPLVLERLKKVPELIRQDLAVSLAAQIMTLPIIALNFHQISLVGILVNTLVLWTVLFIMISGAASIAISFLSIIPYVLLTYFVYTINFFNSLPFSNLEIPKTSLLIWVGYYLLIGGIMLNLKHVQRPDFERPKESG